MSTDASIQGLAKAINASWRKTTENVLDTAKLCADANGKLKVDEKKKLIALLDCGAATFSKLAKIGERQELQSDKIKSLLPPSYSIVYEVAKLPTAELNAAVEKGIINHKMTRADILTWMAERTNAGVKTFTETKPIVIGTLQVKSDYDGVRQAQLEKDLEKLRAKYDFVIERPHNPLEAAFNRVARQIDDYIRKHARQFLKTLKARKLSGAGVKLTASEAKKLWPYSDDETEIAQDAGWDRVKAVLDFVGNGDQFERIRDEALRLHGLPETAVGTADIDDQEDAMEEMRKVIAERNARLNRKHDPEKFAGWK